MRASNPARTIIAIPLSAFRSPRPDNSPRKEPSPSVRSLRRRMRSANRATRSYHEKAKCKNFVCLGLADCRFPRRRPGERARGSFAGTRDSPGL
ncbi:hypothetical protein PUN28_009591 [Cardiocondyla obscurior]|uniref:Uncharacterized protein n=1 Tax=Cardiocondyla obscurior TaxID=286306 RepID=A0AAW2FTE4_9HYME